jgi:poly-gamma-glutamate synthesis protein (capsule biosynthesis protein)
MIKILAAGDFCPVNRIEKLVSGDNIDLIYNDFMPILEGNDINIVNLECPLANQKSPIPKIGPSLIAGEKCIEALKYGNFNLLTLSNNHIMDQGEAGLNSTIRLCRENNIGTLGAGRNENEASVILYREIGNRIFAFLNFSEKEFSAADHDKPGSNTLNPVRNYYSIMEARRAADYVYVFVHGGHEDYSLPSPRMVDTYRFYIDAGADFVIGNHTHCFSGYEKYQKGLIFYSLGNFIFDWDDKRNSPWNSGYCVKFMFSDKDHSFEILPYSQCNEKPGLFLLNPSEKQVFERDLEKLNGIIASNDLLLREWEKFVLQKKDFYLMNYEFNSSRLFRAARSRKLIPSFLSGRKKLMLLNFLQCESHRDLAIESLKTKTGK